MLQSKMFWFLIKNHLLSPLLLIEGYLCFLELFIKNTTDHIYFNSDYSGLIPHGPQGHCISCNSTDLKSGE